MMKEQRLPSLRRAAIRGGASALLLATAWGAHTGHAEAALIVDRHFARLAGDARQVCNACGQSFPRAEFDESSDNLSANSASFSIHAPSNPASASASGSIGSNLSFSPDHLSFASMASVMATAIDGDGPRAGEGGSSDSEATSLLRFTITEGSYRYSLLGVLEANLDREPAENPGRGGGRFQFVGGGTRVDVPWGNGFNNFGDAPLLQTPAFDGTLGPGTYTLSAFTRALATSESSWDLLLNLSLINPNDGLVFSWLGGDGDFGDATRWSPDGVPGSGADTSALIEAPGTYSVSGAPERALDLLRVGNATGTVTLEPILDPVVAARFAVTGDTRVEFGTVESTLVMRVRDDATLTVGTEGIVLTGGNDALSPATNVDGTLEVSAGGTLGVAGDLAVGAQEDAVSTLRVHGTNAFAEVGDLLEAAGGNASHASLEVREEGLLAVAGSLVMAAGADSSSELLLSGPGSAIRGPAGTGGVPVVSLGESGSTLAIVESGAELAVASLLVLGGASGGDGTLLVGAGGGRVVAPGAGAAALPVEVVIGNEGRGTVLTAGPGGFFAGSPAGGALTVGAAAGGVGELLVHHAARDGTGAVLATDFATTKVGGSGTGSFELADGARWRGRDFTLGEAGSGRGSATVTGADTQLALYGERLLVVGGDGEGALHVTDSAFVLEAGADPLVNAPLSVVVGAGGTGGARAAGRLLVDVGATIIGGPGSSLQVGAGAQGAMGFASLAAGASALFTDVDVGLGSLAPTVDPAVAATLLPPDAPAGTAGHLVVSQGAQLVTGFAQPGSLRIGSRGIAQVLAGGRVETGLLSVGFEDTSVNLDTVGEGGLLRVQGPGSEVVAGQLLVGPEDLGGSVRIEDRAVVSVDTAAFRGRTDVTVTGGGSLVASERILIGPPGVAPPLRSDFPGQHLFDERVWVSVGNASGLVAGESIVIGDDLRAGAFEPLLTYAVLSMFPDAALFTDHLVVANGGMLLGNRGNVFARGTDVLAGAIVSPGFSPGSLFFDGDVDFQPGSTLVLEIGGEAPGVTHDLIVVDGRLSGTVDIDLRFLDGYIPAVGARFALFDVAGLVDLSIASLAVSGLPEGVELAFSLDDLGAMGLDVLAGPDPSAVPQPATLSLLASALAPVLAVGGARRRPRARQRSGTARPSPVAGCTSARREEPPGPL